MSIRLGISTRLVGELTIAVRGANSMHFVRLPSSNAITGQVTTAPHFLRDMRLVARDTTTRRDIISRLVSDNGNQRNQVLCVITPCLQVPAVAVFHAPGAEYVVKATHAVFSTYNLFFHFHISAGYPNGVRMSNFLRFGLDLDGHATSPRFLPYICVSLTTSRGCLYLHFDVHRFLL